MANIANSTGYFKKYAREYREQTMEETFKNGEVFTRAPLDAGEHRLLVNYDIKDDGEAITNRRGYRTNLVGLPVAANDLMPTIRDGLALINSRDAVVETGRHFRLVVANRFLNDDVLEDNTRLYSAPAEMWVIDMNDDAAEYDMLNEYGIPIKGMYAIPISYASDFVPGDNEDYPKSYYTIPRNPEANGMKFEHPEHLGRPVGCFAFGNDYYNFNTNGELIRVRYQPEDTINNILETFYTEKITPKELSIAEATTSGFNMLLPDPYNFADMYTTGPIQFDGIAIYNGSDFIVEPIINTAYKIRCYYQVELNKRYKIVWDYKEHDDVGWTTIEEQDITFNDTYIRELSINNFNCPVSNAILRIRGYKWGPQATATAECSLEGSYAQVYVESFKAQFPNAGTYIFVYSEEDHAWKYDNNIVNLESYGITLATIGAVTDRASITILLTYVNDFDELPEKTLSVGITFVKVPSPNIANKDLKNYDLSKAAGMVYWKNFIWLYGVAQDPTILFCSDVNEPTYFPYPNNIDVFDEPIIGVLPFNDNLLVFTNSKIYQLTLKAEGGWTKKVIQGSLDFTEFDIRFVQVIKNMIFFKSGGYYYMIVPKTLSIQNELAVAPISKNIEEFLDDFENNITDLFKTIYNYDLGYTLLNHYNYLNYEDVHNVYTFGLDNSPLYLNVVLLYNTVDRNWRTYIYESEDMYYPLKTDATKQCTLMSPVKAIFEVNDEHLNTSGVQFIEFARNSVKDFYVPVDTVFVYSNEAWQADGNVMQISFDSVHNYRNYQLLDTGYRNLTVDYKKRYRELQFKFNNTSFVTQRFGMEFLIDGQVRVNQYRYTVDQIIDPDSPNYGLLYINRELIDNIVVPGTTILGINENDINAWTLNMSGFPEVAYWKARVKVSGKGYTPRFRFIAKSEEEFELLGYNWVYRSLYSR